MKHLNDPKSIEMAALWHQLKEQHRETEKMLREIKDHFKESLDGDGIAQVGRYIVAAEPRSRETVDKKELIKEMGRETVEKFLNTTIYAVMSVKSCK